MGIRHLNPATGKFDSDDSIRYASGDINFSRYAGNNPVMFNDPSGDGQWK